MHYGTFPLGREPMEEPPVRLMADAERRGLVDRVRILGEGDTLVIPPVSALSSSRPDVDSVRPLSA
jgi:hypothetical protein